MDKRRIIKSFDNLEPEKQEYFQEIYPRGYRDYQEKIFRLTNARNENFFVAPMETDDAIYLVKVKLEEPKEEKDDDGYGEGSSSEKEPTNGAGKEESYEDNYNLD